MKCLKKLLPNQLHGLTAMNAKKYLPLQECRILSVPPEVAVPQPCAGIIRLDFVGEDVATKWTGQLPSKRKRI